MRKTLLVWAAAGAMTVSAGALVACGGSGPTSSQGHPTASQLNQGVNILDASNAAWGMNSAYVKGGHVMYLETRIGALKPDVYRQAFPNDPQNEIDFRAVDESGQTIYIQRGGDNIVDPQWRDDFVAGMKLPALSVADSEAEFALAQEGAKAVGAALPAGFQDHVYHLQNFGSMTVPIQDADFRAASIATQVDPATGYASSTFTSVSSIQLWKGTVACVLWICGYHGATLQMNGSGGQSMGMCNHGRCAGDSGMSKPCGSHLTTGPGGTVSGEINCSGSSTSCPANGQAVSGGCQTSYNWDTPPGHECQDDSAYELWQVHNGGVGGTTAGTSGNGSNFVWNNDSNGHYYACNCNMSGDSCSGDWQSPQCL